MPIPGHFLMRLGGFEPPTPGLEVARTASAGFGIAGLFLAKRRMAAGCRAADFGRFRQGWLPSCCPSCAISGGPG